MTAQFPSKSPLLNVAGPIKTLDMCCCSGPLVTRAWRPPRGGSIHHSTLLVAPLSESTKTAMTAVVFLPLVLFYNPVQAETEHKALDKRIISCSSGRLSRLIISLHPSTLLSAGRKC